MSEIHDVYVGDDKSWIELCTGELFYPNKPRFDVEAIAEALAKNCRFNGHSAIFYSVAQHSLMVAEIMLRDGADPLEGLLHDATEAYLTDVPAPFKQFLPDFGAIDKKWETQLRKDFNLPERKSEACSRADWLALFVEADVFMPQHGKNFQDPFGYRRMALNDYADLRHRVRERNWRDVANEFKHSFHRYRA